MRKSVYIAVVAVLAFAMGCDGGKTPEPYGALPSPQQVEWQKMEMNMFAHFGPNTFTGAEWGKGTESEDIFAPTGLDCGQWAEVAKETGFGGVIITAKHHDGFCLWPNPVSQHTVAQSSWRDGKGDILKELSEACAGQGLKFGVYISPWDRNDPHYGSEEYNQVFCATIRSALSSYGPVFEQWFDGACGEGPNGKRQVYSWPSFHSAVFSNQPDAIIFSDVGPGCRWIGNEEGKAGETCWSTLDTTGFAPGKSPDVAVLNSGDMNGEAWVTGEADVSIRPGWFWKESENDKVKTVSQLLDIYYASVGRNALFLLNVPPDTRGLIHENDVQRLHEFRSALDEIFGENLAEGAKAKASSKFGCKYPAANILDGDFDSYWAAKEGETTAEIVIELDGEKTFNRVLLQEYIPLGQRVAAFTVEARDALGNWRRISNATTIGYKRILLTDKVTATAVKVIIEESLAEPLLNGFGLYLDEIMEEPEHVDADKGVVMDAKEHYVLDLGDSVEADGFFYEPMTQGRNGVVITYNLEYSTDGKKWKPVFEDKMFDNIVNNPIRQDVAFDAPVTARYLRLTPLRTSQEETYGVREMGAL